MENEPKLPTKIKPRMIPEMCEHMSRKIDNMIVLLKKLVTGKNVDPDTEARAKAAERCARMLRAARDAAASFCAAEGVPISNYFHFIVEESISGMSKSSPPPSFQQQLPNDGTVYAMNSNRGTVHLMNNIHDTLHVGTIADPAPATVSMPPAAVIASIPASAATTPTRALFHALLHTSLCVTRFPTPRAQMAECG